MKHLKIRGELVGHKRDRVKITILEQTHFFKDFGNVTDKMAGSAFTHGEGLLNSDGEEPSYVGKNSYAVDTKYYHWLFVKGRAYHKGDVGELLTLEAWAVLKETVKAYNEWGADQP
jgi:hypothetical protein